MTQNHLSFQGAKQQSRARPDNEACKWGLKEAVRVPQSEVVAPELRSQRSKRQDGREEKQKPRVTMSALEFHKYQPLQKLEHVKLLDHLKFKGKARIFFKVED